MQALDCQTFGIIQAECLQDEWVGEGVTRRVECWDGSMHNKGYWATCAGTSKDITVINHIKNM